MRARDHLLLERHVGKRFHEEDVRDKGEIQALRRGAIEEQHGDVWILFKPLERLLLIVSALVQTRKVLKGNSRAGEREINGVEMGAKVAVHDALFRRRRRRVVIPRLDGRLCDDSVPSTAVRRLVLRHRERDFSVPTGRLFRNTGGFASEERVSLVLHANELFISRRANLSLHLE